MKCQNCGSQYGGMFLDSCGWFKINLCGECAKDLGYPINNLKSSRKCFKCGKAFIPKGTWQKICTGCWIKAQPKKKTDSFFTYTPNNPQRKLNEVIPNGK